MKTTMIGILAVLVVWGFASTTTHADYRRDRDYHRGSYTYTETHVSFGAGINISFGGSDRYGHDHHYDGRGNRGGYGRSYPVYNEPVYVEPVRVVPIRVVPVQVPMQCSPNETLYRRIFVGDHYEYRPVSPPTNIYVRPSREYSRY